jgi:hypothetical protein
MAIFLDWSRNLVIQGVVQTPPAPPGLSRTFGLIIDGLRRAAAVRMSAKPSIHIPPDPSKTHVLWAIYNEQPSRVTLVDPHHPTL